MRQIKLTEDHKSKLLEMCKVLFPQYVEITIHEREIDENYNIITFYEEKDLDGCIYNEIHWFEFCMTFLMYKLSYEFSKIKSVGLKLLHTELWSLNKGDHFTKHPVDYLYEQYKLLK